MDFAKDKNRTILERVPMSMPRAVVVAAAVGTAFGLGVVSARAAGPSAAQQPVVDVARRTHGPRDGGRCAVANEVCGCGSS